MQLATALLRSMQPQPGPDVVDRAQFFFQPLHPNPSLASASMRELRYSGASNCIAHVEAGLGTLAVELLITYNLSWQLGSHDQWYVVFNERDG